MKFISRFGGGLSDAGRGGCSIAPGRNGGARGLSLKGCFVSGWEVRGNLLDGGRSWGGAVAREEGM